MDKNTFEEFRDEYMKNANQINEHKEIWRASELFFKEQIRYATQIERELLEYMGYEESYLTTKQGLKKYKKDELIEVILRQRTMCRKLLNELDNDKKTAHIQELDAIYMRYMKK